MPPYCHSYVDLGANKSLCHVYVYLVETSVALLGEELTVSTYLAPRQH
jgi:hypothetical protein